MTVTEEMIVAARAAMADRTRDLRATGALVTAIYEAMRPLDPYVARVEDALLGTSARETRMTERALRMLVVLEWAEKNYANQNMAHQVFRTEIYVRTIEALREPLEADEETALVEEINNNTNLREAFDNLPRPTNPARPGWNREIG